MSMPYKKLLCIAFAAVFLSSPLLAQNVEPSRVLHVTGRGEISLPTVYTEIRLGVDRHAKTAGEAHREAAKESDRLVRFLKSKKVMDLQTTGISLQPIFDSSKLSSASEAGIREYRAVNTVVFRVKTEDAGTVIDGAVKEGASRIDRLTFLPEPAELEKARKEALRRAVGDAKTQAETVLSVLNLSIKEIVQIHVDESGSGPILQTEMRMVQTPVVGGNATVTARVTLQVKY